MAGTAPNQDSRRHGRVALLLAGLVACMTGLAFASVPLYRLFCQVTGYGGVPQRAEQAPAETLDRTIRVRFDANVDRALPWRFVPLEIECFCFKEQTLAPGASIEMPVTFFVDPKIVEDEDTRNIDEITLSYTFYRTGEEPGVAAAPAAGNSGS